ncbi:MAG: hypothetical protein WBV22_01680 [Anaerolineaceae bacterium]
MPEVNEIDIIKILDDTLSQIEDPAIRDRILKWAWDKYSTKTVPLTIESPKILKTPSSKTKKKKSQKKAKLSLSIVKDLNLKPSGKKSFKQFVQEKLPKDNQEKCTVAIYYMKHELGVDKITIDHIHTCCKDVGWRTASLYNDLARTASRKGWIDTSEMSDIRITTLGDNFVEYDLPPQNKK